MIRQGCSVARNRSQRTQLGRILLRVKGQPRAMNRALSCRWQHAAMYLRVPRVAPTSRAATSSPRLVSFHLASPRLASPYRISPYRTSPRLTSPSSSPSSSPHLTSPRFVPSRLVSPRLTSPRSRAHASNVFLRRARFFARRPSFPPFRAYACTYFFVNLIAPTRSFLLYHAFFA